MLTVVVKRETVGQSKSTRTAAIVPADQKHHPERRPNFLFADRQSPDRRPFFRSARIDRPNGGRIPICRSTIARSAAFKATFSWRACLRQPFLGPSFDQSARCLAFGAAWGDGSR